MKQPSLHKTLNKSLAAWPAGSRVQLKNFYVDFFVSLYRACNIPVVLTYPDELFDDVLRYCSIILDDARVVCIPPPFSKISVPGGFISKQRQQHDRSLSLFSSGIDNISFILCSCSSFSIPIIPPAGGGLNVSSTVDFEVCVGFLQDQGYSLVDIISQSGEYAVRGGIIDVFPFSSVDPYRINFLGDCVAIHIFDINTQITKRAVDGLFLPDACPSGLVSLDEALSSSFLFLFYGSIANSFCNDELNMNSLCQGIKYHDFVEGNINKNSCFIDENLSSLAAQLPDGSVVVPPWFLGETPIIKTASNGNVPKTLNLSAISRGDFLVHKNHGVGVCLGLGDKEGGGQEFLSIKYGDGGIVRVDSGRLDLVDYYAPSDEQDVLLDSLNKQSAWNKKYNSAKKAAQETVEKLLKLYVNRNSVIKRPFFDGGDLENKFIEEFPYVDTIDQLAAWREIAADLSRDVPMDRLLCGDVGFGKTEIAMRAAFRCVVGGCRVVVLAPTTILVNQLYKAFVHRLGAYAVNVAFVSRLQPKKSINIIIDNIDSGENDVLIGTHAILKNDIYLKNIGLLVIDEEHRFGVRHKEKIKSYKENIDVLSMSATPIPRSMNLALSGIYSISLLQTPPLMRIPIITRIEYYDETLIKNSILYEINSGGQVFFVHNKVQTISLVVDGLSRLLPDLKIVSLHGQEAPSIIENKMDLFSTKKIHVLVCTSIIEAGIDVPSANCIIINNAHQFGLSQLYQIRGRVGRGHRQAYAYLLIPKNIALSKTAYSRIKAIEKNWRLGSGYNIAHSDMGIRGSGHLFGYKQSGAGNSVGYEMYMRLIQRSLHSLDRLSSDFIILPEDVFVEIYKNRYIPEKYISIEGVRLSFYKAISSASSAKELGGIYKNIENRFGALPTPVNNLINESLLRLLAAQVGVSSIFHRGCGVVCKMGFVDNNDVFSSFLDYINIFFNKRNIDFHILPPSAGPLSLCIHIFDVKDKYSLLSRFLNKFKSVN